jgi:site-specific recombinase XerD
MRQVAQKALNHADIKSTLRYCHVLDSDVADAVERVASGKKVLGKMLGAVRNVS